jgi:hypothetical protein
LPPAFVPINAVSRFFGIHYCDCVTARSNRPAEIDRSEIGAGVTIDSGVKSSQERRFIVPRKAQQPENWLPAQHPERSCGWKSCGPGGLARTERHAGSDCATGEGYRRTPPLVKDVHRPTDWCEIRPPLGGRIRPLFLHNLPCSSGKDPRSLFSLDGLVSPAPSRFLARVGGPTGVVGCGRLGATLARNPAHATDPAVQQQRAAAVGDEPCRCAARMPAPPRPSGSRGPGNRAPAAVIPC